MADIVPGSSNDPALKAYGAKAIIDKSGNVNSKVPGAAGYLQAVNLAKLAYGNALTRINQGRSDLLRQFGYTGTIDPKQGTLTGLHVDPYNPYGAYQDMLHSGAQAGQQAYAAAVNRGIGGGSWGGLAGQMQTQVEHDFGQASQQLGTSLSQGLFGFSDQLAQAGYEKDMAKYSAMHQAVQEAIAARQFTVAQAAQSQALALQRQSLQAQQAATSGSGAWGL